MIPRQIATYRIREYLIESFAMFIIHNSNESNLQQMCKQFISPWGFRWDGCSFETRFFLNRAYDNPEF